MYDGALIATRYDPRVLDDPNQPDGAWTSLLNPDDWDHCYCETLDEANEIIVDYLLDQEAELADEAAVKALLSRCYIAEIKTARLDVSVPEILELYRQKVNGG